MFDGLRGKRVTVMGLGRFGGGIGAVRFLAERGARVTLTDLADEAQLAESLAAISDVPLERLRLGRHDDADFRDTDLIVASPAVPRDHPLLRTARAPITTEIGLFWSRCRSRVISVTGTVGKSTTSAMIHAVLVAAGRTSWLGGNIGGSLLPEIDRMEPDDWVVLELSSFQLEYLASLRPRSHISVVTNFRPNHLDRHFTLDAYRKAKQSLLQWQTPSDVAVLNGNDDDVRNWYTQAQTLWFNARTTPNVEEPPLKTDVSLVGSELILPVDEAARSLATFTLRRAAGPLGINATAAAAAAFAAKIDAGTIVSALNEFRGLPHRMEELGTWGGRTWINDSKATTPEAAIAALGAFDFHVRLIAGGADKGVDLSALAEAIRSSGAHVYLSGQTAQTIANRLVDHAGRVECFDGFDASVLAAIANSKPGEIILLSPGCASWGQFRDYRERGERFRALVASIEAAEAPSDGHLGTKLPA